jgi:hypothetical protein
MKFVQDNKILGDSNAETSAEFNATDEPVVEREWEIARV